MQSWFQFNHVHILFMPLNLKLRILTRKKHQDQAWNRVSETVHHLLVWSSRRLCCCQARIIWVCRFYWCSSSRATPWILRGLLLICLECDHQRFLAWNTHHSLNEPDLGVNRVKHNIFAKDAHYKWEILGTKISRNKGANSRLIWQIAVISVKTSTQASTALYWALAGVYCI